MKLPLPSGVQDEVKPLIVAEQQLERITDAEHPSLAVQDDGALAPSRASRRSYE